MVDYKELEEVDLKLCLLSGSSIKVENLVIKPYTLEEIKEYGYSNYMRNLQMISISIDDFLSSIDDVGKRNILKQQKEHLRTLDFYCKFGGSEFQEMLINSFKMLFRTDDVRQIGESVIAVGFKEKGIIYEDEDGEIQINSDILESIPEDELMIIHRDNFDSLVEVIKIQNYLQKPKEKNIESNPVDAETKKLMEDMEKHRKRVEAKKKAQQVAEKGEEDNIDISDIVSAVSSKSNSINKLNIWSFTLYQIYDEYSRLELIDNYDFSIRAMMAGADKVDLKHWSSKL